MMLRSRLANVERTLVRTKPTEWVPIYDDDVVADLPEYHDFQRRIAELDRLRNEAPASESHQYAEAEKQVWKEFSQWKEEMVNRLLPVIKSLRWPDHDVLVVRHSYSEDKR
jgi:hypothetical protein